MVKSNMFQKDFWKSHNTTLLEIAPFTHEDDKPIVISESEEKTSEPSWVTLVDTDRSDDEEEDTKTNVNLPEFLRKEKNITLCVAGQAIDIYSCRYKSKHNANGFTVSEQEAFECLNEENEDKFPSNVEHFLKKEGRRGTIIQTDQLKAFDCSKLKEVSKPLSWGFYRYLGTIYVCMKDKQIRLKLVPLLTGDQRFFVSLSPFGDFLPQPFSFSEWETYKPAVIELPKAKNISEKILSLDDLLCTETVDEDDTDEDDETLQERIDKLQKEKKTLQLDNEERMKEVYKLTGELEDLKVKFKKPTIAEEIEHRKKFIEKTRKRRADFFEPVNVPHKRPFTIAELTKLEPQPLDNTKIEWNWI